MKIAITGSSGLVGSAVLTVLNSKSHEILRLVRKQTNEKDAIYWNPESKEIDRDRLEGLEAVVNLAGENIAKARWTPQIKKRIFESRIGSTEFLSQTLSNLKSPPKVLISASAIGFYGNREDQILTEQSLAGDGFLSDLCTHWERATKSASDAGIRVVNLRIGIVLSKEGGALKEMLKSLRSYLGGPLGDGRQFMSWISLDDLVQSILYCAQTESLAGPVNAVAPHPVTNNEFTKTLAKILNRPAIFRAPKLVLKLALGEMAEALLFSSARVKPEKLERAHFKFRHPDLAEALKEIL